MENNDKTRTEHVRYRWSLGAWGTLLILGWVAMHVQHSRVAEANHGVKCFSKAESGGGPLPSLVTSPVQAKVKVEQCPRAPATCRQLLSSGSSQPHFRLLSGWLLPSLSERHCVQNSRTGNTVLHGLVVLQPNGPQTQTPRPWCTAIAAATSGAVEWISEFNMRQSTKKRCSKNDCHMLLF